MIDYPLNTGGRPLNSWPVFLLVPFEVGMLAAALSGFVAFLWNCRLPSLYHPVFDTTDFARATQDRFFLLAAQTDEEERSASLREALKHSGALSRDGAGIMKRALLCLILLAVAGCDDQSMRQQNRYDTYAPSKFWPNGSEAQPLPEGVVAQGDVDRVRDCKGASARHQLR